MMPDWRPSLRAVLLVGAGAALGVPVPVDAQRRGDCGYQGVTIVYQAPAELDMACEALADVVKYFGEAGFTIVPDITLSFAATESHQLPLAHGQFDASKRHIVVYRPSTAKPWGLPWSPQLAASFVRHELVHWAVSQTLNGDLARFSHPWHELIAYAVQIDLMSESFRSDLLRKYPDARAALSFAEINEFTYGMNPEAFAVTAYLTYEARGGPTFLQQLLRGSIDPPRLQWPFPHSPD